MVHIYIYINKKHNHKKKHPKKTRVDQPPRVENQIRRLTVAPLNWPGEPSECRVQRPESGQARHRAEAKKRNRGRSQTKELWQNSAFSFYLLFFIFLFLLLSPSCCFFFFFLLLLLLAPSSSCSAFSYFASSFSSSSGKISTFHFRPEIAIFCTARFARPVHIHVTEVRVNSLNAAGREGSRGRPRLGSQRALVETMV